MNLFRKEAPVQQPPSRTTIADMPVALFEIYERIFNRNQRLWGLAQVLGGGYPLPSNPHLDPPIDICARIFYDMSNIRQQLDEMDAHLVRLEQLCGIPTDESAQQKELQQTLDTALADVPTGPVLYATDSPSAT